MASMTAGEIAARVGGELVGDASVAIQGVGGIRYAGPGEIAYISQSRYSGDADTTRASALVVGRDWVKPLVIPVIKVDKPEDVFTTVAQLFAPPPVAYPPGIHPTAVIAAGACIGHDVHIGPYCVIGEGASIGDRSVLVGHNVVGAHAVLGADSLLYPLSSLREHVRIGDRFIAHNGAVIGSDGFGYQADAKGVRTKIPQIGTVEIGDDVEIGANSAIDRARFGKTTIGHGVKIDNLVQVAHNVIIGDHAVLVSQVGIAGSATIGHHAILAGQAGVAGHITIGHHAVIGAQSGVTKDLAPHSFTLGFPAIAQKEFAQNQANVNRLPELKKKIAALESRIKALESGSHLPEA
ncbi:MAG TPA: UDP-3-O-(3-hydroxymyristoyl)glucosamine N-acyltransferase [Kiritimatiellia bacterium]|nr:UDP-3-O-(3-hydroxymyristoyl)glucosamine N-acyltransferase [Kiritimatiellia bacterium]HMP35150.1 UDP-3-O-(3-hydroxymyristoyl)glucosamine N-acyltransferase [Kiritimatiellia bacterium]